MMKDQTQKNNLSFLSASLYPGPTPVGFQFAWLPLACNLCSHVSSLVISSSLILKYFPKLLFSNNS